MKKKKAIIVDGKHEEKFVKTRLDQIWGDTGLTKYKTLEVEEYKSFLNTLNKSDLQSHAVTVGLIPTDNRETLTKRLIKEFQSYAADYKKPDNNIVPNKVSEKVRSILSEGR